MLSVRVCGGCERVVCALREFLAIEFPFACLLHFVFVAYVLENGSCSYIFLNVASWMVGNQLGQSQRYRMTDVILWYLTLAVVALIICYILTTRLFKKLGRSSFPFLKEKYDASKRNLLIFFSLGIAEITSRPPFYLIPLSPFVRVSPQIWNNPISHQNRELWPNFPLFLFTPFLQGIH